MKALVMTGCGYLMPSDTECDGCINVPKMYCEKCLIYSKKRPRVFSLNTPTQTSKKTSRVKVHAFGVTLQEHKIR